VAELVGVSVGTARRLAPEGRTAGRKSIALLHLARLAEYTGGKSARYALLQTLRVRTVAPLLRFEGLPGGFSQHDFREVWVTYQDGTETKGALRLEVEVLAVGRGHSVADEISRRISTAFPETDGQNFRNPRPRPPKNT
jgi:hypothetical protein